MGPQGERLHLTGREVEKLIEAVQGSRNEARDRCLLLLMFRHGFRVSEACRLKLDQVDAEKPRGACRKVEVRVIDDAPATPRRDQGHSCLAERTEPDEAPANVRTFFVSEQRRPLHRSTVNALMKEYSRAAALPLRAHPHMLRHACGFALADQGADTRLIQDYLGHRKIEHTVKYTASNPARLQRLWQQH